ncbi:MAG TPA: DUF2784 domain-containing protein [Cyclobacteriaceae bacterium]|nr:DUF2784 domain-containing protein [Cyclobacteriaceae bacterium]
MDSVFGYQLANIFFFVFHILLILFNLLGWIWKKSRKWNLFTLCLTAFSWFGLGIFYGWGYCPLTDWHWQVRDELGLITPYNSYIQFLIVELSGIKITALNADRLSVIAFGLALGCSMVANFNLSATKKRKRR